jgi:regulator of replication initiation timing
MAVVSVPRPLQDRLGDDATASLVEMLRQLEEEQEERREVQKEHLLQILEERFLRHVADSDHRTRTDLGKEISDVRQDLSKEISDVRKELSAVRQDLGKEISDVRQDLSKQISDVRQELSGVRQELGKEISDVRTELGKEISDVRKEITTQTRWILAVMGAAAVLIPIMQRVMATLIP